MDRLLFPIDTLSISIMTSLYFLSFFLEASMVMNKEWEILFRSLIKHWVMTIDMTISGLVLTHIYSLLRKYVPKIIGSM